MIQGFEYSSGPITILNGKPASAFSAGDVLIYDSTSSLSRIPTDFASGSDIAGVALCDSNLSISNLVPFIVPEAETQFLVSVDTTASTITPGTEYDILYGAGNGREYIGTSANSVRVVVVRGNAGPLALDQSVHSQAIVKFIYHAGNLELS